MNKKIKISGIMAAILMSSASVYAQVNSAVISAPEKVREGNSFEREMTPLLREISKKKSQLELRKLERELAKIDEEEIKSQLEMEELANKPQVNTDSLTGGGSLGSAGLMSNIPGVGAGISVPGMPPVGIPQLGATPPSQIAPPSKPKEEEEEQQSFSDIKVLMIYGFEKNLSAKIAAGAQGGYVVKKGDVMPDGRVVVDVTANYIEVEPPAKTKGKKRNTSKIFVTSGEEASDSDSKDKSMAPGQDSSSPVNKTLLSGGENTMNPEKAMSQLNSSQQKESMGLSKMVNSIGTGTGMSTNKSVNYVK